MTGTAPVLSARVDRRDVGSVTVSRKRRGKGSPADWYVTMTGRDLVALLTGERPE